MTNASKDQNYVSTMIASQNNSSVLPSTLQADPTSHGLAISDGTTGSDFGPKNAARDQNDVPCIMAVSSVDGITPVALYVDAITNALLTQST